MKDFDKERNQIDEEAVEFLRKGLFAEHPDKCPCYVHFAISAYDKKHRAEEYPQGILCFKALFQEGEERYRLALWNMIANYYTQESKFRKEDFSKEEYAFIKAAANAIGDPSKANVNPPIETKRLILRAVTPADLKILAAHFKNEGDFEAYTRVAPTMRNIKRFTKGLIRETYFAIERKDDRKLLGYIGLSVEPSATGLLEYYIFKDERRKGYCKEAVEALTEITLRGKLYGPVETVRRGVYRKRAVRLNAIRARISALNTASQRTVESCGFVHEATIHKIFYQRTAGWVDEKIYYLTSEIKKDKILL